VEISRSFPPLVKLNGGSLDDPRVTVHAMDAFKFLETSNGLYDAIIADLPDPKNLSLARLYSREFYTMARRRLSRQGILVTQSTSPYFAPRAFWAIRATLEAAGFPHIRPYHAYVPSFGDWGFIMAANRRIRPETIRIAVPTRYLDAKLARGLFVFSKDDIEDDVKPSSLNSPEILRYYLEGWKQWQ
jgi:spermidine synthase